MRSFWIASSSSTSRMVGDSGIVAVARYGGRRPSGRTIAPVVAASDSPGRGGRRTPEPSRPPTRRRRARRGSPEQPINGRARPRRGAAPDRAAAPARAHDRPARPVPRVGAAAVVRRAVGDGARRGARPRLPRPRAGVGGRRRRGRLGARRSSASTASRRAEDAWDETIPGLGRVRLRNLVTVVPGATPDAILVLSHRDNSGVGPGANDNASGTAALIELARGYGRLGTVAGRPKPQHTLIFLSSDGGAFGGYGAERFASTSPLREQGQGGRLARRARGHREAPARDRGVRAALAGPGADPDGRRPGRRPGRAAAGPSRAGSSSSSISACPFGYGEQAPFLGRKISAHPAHDRRRQRRGCRERHAGPPRSGPVRAARPGQRVDPGLARRRHRARRGDGRARLPGKPDHSRLDDRARPHRLARARSSSARSTSSPAPGGGACRCRAPGARSGRGSASGSGSGS